MAKMKEISVQQKFTAYETIFIGVTENKYCSLKLSNVKVKAALSVCVQV